MTQHMIETWEYYIRAREWLFHSVNDKRIHLAEAAKFNDCSLLLPEIHFTFGIDIFTFIGIS